MAEEVQGAAGDSSLGNHGLRGEAARAGSACVAPAAFHLDKEDSSPLWIQLRDQVVRGIRGGTLPYGSKMPTVRNLAKELGVSVSVVNQAYRFLRLTGYLEARQGSGVRVRVRTDSIRDSDIPLVTKATEDYIARCEELGLSGVEIMDTLRFYLGWREFVQTDGSHPGSPYYDEIMGRTAPVSEE